MLISETFHGYIETTQDALLIFESCRRGLLPKICRRLQERERKMIRSGSIFVFDERESGIKRWTDGRVWSPSRILGNFLIYREVDKKKNGDKQGHTIKERQLVGSLSDSFRFKSDGLIKKTMSLIVNGVAQHLISYYDPQEVMDAKLRTPSLMPELASLEISPELLARHHFRVPPTVEPSDEDPSGQLTPPDSYDRHVQPLRSMSVGSIRRSSITHQQQSQLYHPYSHPQHRIDHNNHNNNTLNNSNNNNNRPQSPITTYQHPLSSIPTNLYNTPAISNGNNNNDNNNNNININGFSTMPSPSSIGSSPMPSPVRSHSYQHHRMSVTASPRFDVPRQDNGDFERSHSLGQLHQDQIRLHPIMSRHSFDYYQKSSQDDLQFPF